jgi:hypothetical protein
MLSDLEWIGGLYSTETVVVEVGKEQIVLSGGGRVCVPSENLEAVTVAGARKTRQGVQYTAGFFVYEDALLEAEGLPGSVEALWSKRADYRYIKRVVPPGARKGSSVMRTRPMFRNWSLEFRCEYLEDIIPGMDHLVDTLKTAGQICGLGDYRPRFGRFTVDVL